MWSGGSAGDFEHTGESSGQLVAWQGSGSAKPELCYVPSRGRYRNSDKEMFWCSSDQWRERSSTYTADDTVIGLIGPESSGVTLCLIRQEAGPGRPVASGAQTS